MLVILLLIIILYVLYKNGQLDFHNKEDESLKKLKEKYINGEIDEETYLRMKKNIES
ncbi:MAG: hypothetical protein H5T96_06560 [Tissierellales bacterium]|jgi:putative membrane protein|nr:hypothetical protein [Tissierellales bacterium]